MSKLRKQFITVLAVLFCALLCISAALIIPKSKSAYANRQTGSSYWTVIGSSTDDLYKGDTNPNYPIDRNLLRSLYMALTGDNNFVSLTKTLANNNNKITSADFRNLSSNNGKNVSVYFGGVKWDATYLTFDKNGNVILDLWQSADDPLTINYSSVFSYKEEDNPNDAYPSNMYSSSYIRVKELNTNGSYYNQHLVITAASQDSTHRYAKFTMGGSGSLTQFIVQPTNVGYQANESRSTIISGTNDVPNEAYDHSATGVWGSASANYESNPHYGEWQYDYLWIPSHCEVGGKNGNVTVVNGIWMTDQNLRSTTGVPVWTRTGSGTLACSVYMLSSGEQVSDSNSLVHSVRPAMHFNLTAAAEASGGIYFGTADTEISEDRKTAELKHGYDGETVEIEVPDNDKLTKTAESDSGFYTGGVFSATVPNESSDKSYTITVQPNTNYYWLDVDSADWTVEKVYKITIKAAEITVGWNLNPDDIPFGESLLQESTLLTGKGNQTIKQFIYVAKPPNAETATPPDVSQWTERKAETENDFIAEDAGVHRVYYNITAKYHKPAKGSYDIEVVADAVKITFDGDASIGSAQYGTGHALDLSLTNQDTLKQAYRGKVKITSVASGYEYAGQDKIDLFKKLKIVVYKYNGNTRQNASPNDRNYYNVGTYYLAVQYADDVLAEEKTLSFTYDNDTGTGRQKYPTFTVEKKAVTVKAVPSVAGGDFTHIYGDDCASLKWEIVSGAAIGEDETHLGLKENVFKTKETGEALGSATPAGKYVIEGEEDEGCNYSVTFNGSTRYEVTKRAVTLQVADEEVEYGTSFTDYTFNELTEVDGTTLATGENLSDILTLLEYSLKFNGNNVDFSDSLVIGEYELNAKAEADNYTFTVLPGKLTVTKKNFNMSGVTFTNKGYVYDGNPHAAQIDGTLPSDEITVSYRYVNTADGSESTEAPIEIGLYLVYATFTHNNGNYNDIDTKVAYLRIAATAEEANAPFPQLPTDEEIAAAADLAKKKTEAKKSLDEEAKAKKDAIDNNADMSAEDKKAAKEEIEKELADGNASIDKATSADGVNKAYDDGKKEMEDTVELAETKTDAKKDLEKEAKDKKDAIDADLNLTPEEKKAAKEEVDKKLAEGKKEIDKSTNPDDAKAAENASEKNIEDYTEVVQKKGSAKSELDKAAQAKKDAIDANPELTDEEKQAAKDKVDEELAKGKAGIDSATDVSGIQAVESSTKTNIENIKPEHSGSFPWWILAVIAGAILLVTVLIIVIVKRRNAEDEDDGYDDFYDDEYDYEEEEESDDGDEAYGF